MSTFQYHGVTKVAKNLGVSRQTVYRWVDSGVLEAVKIGGRILISTAAVDKMLEANRVEPSDE